MALNAAWHRAHPMPRNPTQAQRFAWHRAHAKHCGCRPIPPRLAAEMRAAARPARKPAATSGVRRRAR